MPHYTVIDRAFRAASEENSLLREVLKLRDEQLAIQEKQMSVDDQDSGSGDEQSK